MASVFINLPTISSSAPVGGATEAKQDVGNASLASIDSKTPALGQALAAGSVPVVLTATQLATLTPPAAITGYATETTLSAINTKTPALGQALAAASVPVVIPALQLSAIASETTLSAQNTLIGAVTETAPATDTASSGLNGRLQRIAQRITSLIALLPASLGTKAAASSLATTWSTEDEALIGALTETAPATDTASSGLNGRLQRVAQRLTSLIALVPASLGQKTMANSFAVTLASDQTAIPTSATQQTTSGTITSTQKSVGTSQVRATVSGSAPSATRKRLYLKPSKNNTGAVYFGPTGLSTSSAMEIIGPDRLEFILDASDYFLISDSASQVVEIVEVV